MIYDVNTILECNGVPVRFSGILPGNYEDIDETRLHPAVIVLAGGAYWIRAEHEKEPAALKFLAQGISPWVLEYSVAPAVFPQALCEVLAAVAWLRAHGKEYHIDTDNISLCGFSAGGHLAASAGCFWNRDFIQESLGHPGRAVRPDKLILCYPVITSGEYTHQGSIENLLGGAGKEDREKRELVSLEKQVGEDYPATFLWHTAEDASVPVQNALMMGQALAEKGVRLELHIYPKGAHGLSTGDFTSRGELTYGKSYGCSDWVEKAVAFIYQSEFV